MMIARNQSATLATVIGILGAGLLLCLWNADLPVVRNSLVYAKVAESITEHGSPLPVIADEHLSYGKPILYSIVSAPFISAFGVTPGLRITSYLGTLFMFCVAFFFFRRMNRQAGVDPRYLWLEMLFLAMAGRSAKAFSGRRLALASVILAGLVAISMTAGLASMGGS